MIRIFRTNAPFMSDSAWGWTITGPYTPLIPGYIVVKASGAARTKRAAYREALEAQADCR